MKKLYLYLGVLSAALGAPAFGQYLPSYGAAPQTVAQAAASDAAAVPVASTSAGSALTLSPDVQILSSFKDSDAKFDVEDLMDVLRDKRHEGWVLAAYPDPKTAQPLIGAGFSLDLPQRDHPQNDPLNPHPFLETSSADLWLAAGLAPEKRQAILADFYDKLAALDKRGFRLQIRTLEPQITEDDANALLRIGIVQAIDNAKAYCRNFDRMSASQQMAMTQLVYQMGYNLQQFSTFLGLVNSDRVIETRARARADRAYWRQVQLSLVKSQWARLYRDRAKAVIAMLDPSYDVNPTRAERSIGAVLRPVRRHHARRASLRRASYVRHRGSAAHRRAARVRKD